jgi:cytochrome c oxidase accessory protein FixG
MSFHRYRSLVYTLLTLLFFGLPFVQVGGESALRFDVPTLRLLFFGSAVWMSEFFIVLVALLFLAFLFIWVTLVFGRVWCGWICPQMLLVSLTEKRSRAGYLVPRGLSSHVKALLLSILTGAAMVWYFVSPYEFLPRLALLDTGRVEGWAWAILAGITWLNLLFLRETFCATVCPYAKLQGALLDRDSLIIAYDTRRAGECIDCKACAKVCPVGIDIRGGLQAACVNCAECVDACTHILSKKGRPSLVGYFCGAPGGSLHPFRPTSFLLGAATLLLLVLFLLLSLQRSPLGLTLLPNHDYPPRTTPEGRILVSYTLALENRAAEAIVLEISATGPAAPVDISPGTVTIGGGEHRNIPIYVVTAGAGALDILLTAGDGEVLRSPAKVMALER